MNKDRIKVLHIVTSLAATGVPTLLYNYYKHMDRTLIQFEFVAIPSDIEHAYKEKFEQLGCKVYYMPKAYKGRISFLYNLIRKNRYDIVHSHIELASAIYLTIAKFAGVKTRIAHAHMAFLPYSKWIHKLLRIQLNYVATHKLGCSKKALEGLYGKNNVKTALVLHNAIDIEKFSYDEEVRNVYRKNLNIENKIVVGFVGRFTHQKNIFYLLDIFSEYVKLNPDSLLVVAGDGELKEEFFQKVRDKKLDSKFKYLGPRGDIPSLMMAMDYLLLPSLWEGLGIVLIEAQAAALMTFTSKNTVPVEDTKVSEYIRYLDINESPSVWAKNMTDILLPYKKHDIKHNLITHHYDIKKESFLLFKYYLDLGGRGKSCKSESTYVRYILFYQSMYRKGWKRFAKLLYWLNRLVFSCDIPYTVKIGKQLSLPHFGLGVVVHPNTIIGDNVKIYHQVTIGARNGKWNSIIGNNVLLGTGCKIWGDIHIGNNVQVGANSVVLKDLPDNSTAIGIPAKIILK